MTLLIFTALLGGALVLFALSFLVDKRKQWKHDVLKGITGVKTWRTRLDGLTDRFVALGADPLLARAASKTNDPALARLSGQTLTLYRQLKDHYLSISYAYNCGARAVQQTEALFKPKGAMKLITVRRATKLAEQGFSIKEISPERYLKFATPAKFGPKPPVYQLEFVLTAFDKLAVEIVNGLKQIAEAPAKVAARLTTADQNLKAAQAQNTFLLEREVSYLPFDERVAAINVIRTKVSTMIEGDPLGALALCADLDRAIQALATELEQAKQQLAAVNAATNKLAETTAWVAKVRGTSVTCPWSDQSGQPSCWRLSTADSDPDSQLHQASTLLTQARQSLANGQLPAVAGECKQAQAACSQAEKMVKAVIDAKTAVDEQVPRVRGEVVSLRSELVGITGGATTHEMAQLVERTCAGVESRITEVHNLYTQQLFPEALNLLTGTAGSEYGMPVAKMLAQGKELLQLFKKAAQLASSLTTQTK